MPDIQRTFLFLVISQKKKESNNKAEIINEYTIHDTAYMYIKTAFPIHDRETCINLVTDLGH